MRTDRVLTLRGKSLCEMLGYEKVEKLDEDLLRRIADARYLEEIDNGQGKIVAIDIQMKALANFILGRLN